MSKPELFVEPDRELPLALLDQKEVLPITCLLYLACEEIQYTHLSRQFCFSGW